jgi:hypothetical protein
LAVKLSRFSEQQIAFILHQAEAGVAVETAPAPPTQPSYREAIELGLVEHRAFHGRHEGSERADVSANRMAAQR